jgi:hypothetical protein
MSELAQFHAFVGAQLQTGDPDLSPEEVFDLWLDQHPGEAEDDTEAIREALDDMAAGDTGIPLEEFKREFRRKHQIP